MFPLIIWMIIGGAVGGGVHWFMENRSGMSQILSVIIGLVAGVVGGWIFIQFGTVIVNEGPLPLVSFLAAAVASALVVLITELIKR